MCNIYLYKTVNWTVLITGFISVRVFKCLSPLKVVGVLMRGYSK